MLTDKQEKFTLNLMNGMSNYEAYVQAGYSTNAAITTQYENACRMAKSSKVLARHKELSDKMDLVKIAGPEERKQILSEIARGRLSNFIECGQDGSWINIDKDRMNTAALQAIDSSTKYNNNGAEPTLVTKIRLHNPVQAIAELNKMEKLYEPESKVINYNDIKILVVYESEKPAG